MNDIELKDYLAAVLERPAPPLPPKTQHIGASSVNWWEPNPGDVVIMASGGTVDDRTYAEQLVRIQLEGSGYRRVSFYPGPEFEKTASWDDIAAKAKRLVDSGNVQLLRNGYNNVVGHVIGDHGEYQTEIGRDDPNSRAITTWTCDCPWDQYAWNRTRQWKKYEGRMCAHTYATLLQSWQTPLDEQISEEQAMQPHGYGLPGQAIGPGHGSPLESPPGGAAPPPPGLPRSFSPEGEPIQGDQMSLFADQPELQQAAQTPYAQQPLAPPTPNDILPPAPLQEPLPFPVPGQTPSGAPAPPNSVSVPGAKPQSPWNPMQWPGGTYSAIMPEGYDWSERDLGLYADTLAKAHLRGEHDLQENPDCPVCGEDFPHQSPYYSRTAAIDVGSVVQLKNDAYGQVEPRAPEYGAKLDPSQAPGYQTIPAGEQGEVLSVDPTTGWLECSFNLSGGPGTSYTARLFLEPSDVQPINTTPSRIQFPRNKP